MGFVHDFKTFENRIDTGISKLNEKSNEMNSEFKSRLNMHDDI